jgi:hypothetical protein
MSRIVEYIGLVRLAGVHHFDALGSTHCCRINGYSTGIRRWIRFLPAEILVLTRVYKICCKLTQHEAAKSRTLGHMLPRLP